MGSSCACHQEQVRLPSAGGGSPGLTASPPRVGLSPSLRSLCTSPWAWPHPRTELGCLRPRAELQASAPLRLSASGLQSSQQCVSFFQLHDCFGRTWLAPSCLPRPDLEPSGAPAWPRRTSPCDTRLVQKLGPALVAALRHGSLSHVALSQVKLPGLPCCPSLCTASSASCLLQGLSTQLISLGDQ